MKFSELFGDKNTLILYSWMFGPSWDKPCPSCTSLMDGFDRAWYSVCAGRRVRHDRQGAGRKDRRVGEGARLVADPAVVRIRVAVSGGLQVPGAENDDMQLPVMHRFTKRDGKIFHFWATETMSNHVDTVWPYWNLMDFTPEGRPDRDTPPQQFRSGFLEKHYLEGELAVVR